MSTKKVKKEKLILVNFKVTQKEYDSLVLNALDHTRGNLSEWIRRMACQVYFPRKIQKKV